MTIHQSVWTIGLLAIVATYNWIYRNDRGRLRDDANSGMSVGSFRPIHVLVKYSTAGVCLASIWSDAGVFAHLFESLIARDIGLLVATSGTVMAIWSKASLGKSYSPCYASVLPSQIVDVGPYQRVRHPLYSSNIVTLLGLAIFGGSLWVLANTLITAAFYFVAAVREEQALADRFIEYKTYLARTGRFLPTLKANRA